MAIVKVADLEKPEDMPRSDTSTSLPVVYVETDIDIARERKAMQVTTAVRSKGYTMYMDGEPLDAVAKALSVPLESVLVWASDGGWAGRLRKSNNLHEELVRENVRRVRLERAVDDAKSSLRLGRRIRAVVEKKLENPDELRSMDVKNLADASKASVDTSAHGMGASASEDGGAADGDKRHPLVIIFQDGLPPKREPKTVEGEVIG